jgi:hypothetical protein
MGCFSCGNSTPRYQSNYSLSPSNKKTIIEINGIDSNNINPKLTDEKLLERANTTNRNIFK